MLRTELLGAWEWPSSRPPAVTLGRLLTPNIEGKVQVKARDGRPVSRSSAVSEPGRT